MSLKRQVGRGSAAVGRGAVGFTCRLCHAVRMCPGLALVTWWQSGCQPVPLPAWGEQWPLALPPPACTLVRGQAALCLGFQPLCPGPPDRVAVEDGPGRTEPQPHPEAGGRFLSSASTWMGTVPRKIGPKPEGCPEGRQDQAERGCVGFDRREATNLSLSKPEVPLPPNAMSCPFSCKKVMLFPWIPVYGFIAQIGVSKGGSRLCCACLRKSSVLPRGLQTL